MTPGCTVESCHFRDLESEFAELGAQPVGISMDQVEKQKEFDDKHQLGFTLLSDPDQTIASTLGAKRKGPFGNKRITYVIGQDRSILEIIKSETNMNVHADSALDILKK
jgi:peroxiredoxin Q/BCP